MAWQCRELREEKKQLKPTACYHMWIKLYAILMGCFIKHLQTVQLTWNEIKKNVCVCKSDQVFYWSQTNERVERKNLCILSHHKAIIAVIFDFGWRQNFDLHMLVCWTLLPNKSKRRKKKRREKNWQSYRKSETSNVIMRLKVIGSWMM